MVVRCARRPIVSPFQAAAGIGRYPALIMR
jgi:hypothetical protein